MCKGALQEDEEIDEEDVERETGIIRVQLAYVLQMLVRYSLFQIILFSSKNYSIQK